MALAREGAALCVIGRDGARLSETVTAAQVFSNVTAFQFDLTSQDGLQPLVRFLEQGAGRLDALLHCAGVFQSSSMEESRVEDLDAQYAVNVRVPYTVTQQLLPFLAAARGDVVFINSSAGLNVKRPDVGQYAATKHALRAIADSLRVEVNPQGIRVLSVYLGRTATPMQEAICKREGKIYKPQALLQPEDVASIVLQLLSLPPTAEVTDISIRPLIREQR